MQRNEEKLGRLSELEQSAYKEWALTQQPPLPLATAIKMYELFLNSYTTEEIFRVNGQQYPLGMIVDARLRYDWDDRRNSQIESMYSNIENKILRVKNEAVSNLADLLAAAHKIWGDKVKMFLQEGDPALLQGIGLDPSNMKNYKEILAMLSTLTEAKTKQVSGTVQHQHVHVSVDPPKKMSGKVATDLLKLVDAAGGDIIDG